MGSAVIRIGSIIHLQNGENGYLDTRGRVIDKREFWNVAGTERVFVTTHPEPNRDRGSGSWRIISVDGKAEGEPLHIGDKIHLLNMYPNTGYLDCCGWVEHLPPFTQYESHVRCGVFTSDLPNRDNGTGVWKVELAVQKDDLTIHDGDAIHLVNAFPENGLPAEGDFSKTGFLMTHGDVTANEVFKEYQGQVKFVFTSIQQMEKSGAGTWKISLNEPEKTAVSIPMNSYYVWGMLNDTWLDFGSFELSGDSEPVGGLNVRSANEGDMLEGTISYRGKAPIKIKATRHDKNKYRLEHLPNVSWILGGREDRKIVEIDVSSRDNGRSFSGSITYAGESSIPLKGLRATTTLVNGVSKTVLYDFFRQDLWKARIRRMEEALKTAVDEFDDVLLTIDQFSIEKMLQLISEAGGKSYTYLSSDYFRLDRIKRTNPNYANHLETLFNKIGNDDAIDKALATEEKVAEKFTRDVELDHLNKKVEALLNSPHAPLSIEMSANPVDVQNQLDGEFQIKQLLNIYTLWLSMSQFWDELGGRANETIEKLNQAKILPPVHLLRACFRQFTIDFEIIQNCIRQRRRVKNASANDTGDIQAASLIVTDKLAARAMAPFKHLISDSADIIPITFFGNKVHVRQLPYTDKFIFVGLTYDLTQPILSDEQQENAASTPPFELLAIPHEIGHFIYRYVNLVNRQQGSETFAGMSQTFVEHPYYHWCEEIFADLYGCLIAGPFAVLGMQALIATEEKHMVIHDDDEHPAGIFRPYFLSEMLRVLSKLKSEQYDFASIAGLLDANWTAILERWGYLAENINENGRPARIHLPVETSHHTESFINIDKALTLVYPIIDKFARELVSHAKFEPAKTPAEGKVSSRIPWCIGNDSKNGSLDIYIQEIGELADYKYDSKQISDVHLSSKAQMRKSLRESMEYALAGRNELVGSKLFQEILAGWGDKGPHGWGDHT